MPTPTNTLKDHLHRYRQIKITVIGRKSGRSISVPVWFVFEEENLYLLPVQGSDTQWYQNILQKPTIGIEARDAQGKFQAVVITDAERIKPIIEKFREKYGASDVKKYYSKFDVAVLVRSNE